MITICGFAKRIELKRGARYITDANGNETKKIRGGTMWTYQYHPDDSLKKESLSIDNRDYSASYDYKNGHLSSMMTPGNQSIDYAPNAIGQATKAGGYTHSIDYFANGAVKKLRLGNGIQQQIIQNERQLTSNMKYLNSNNTSLINLSYQYSPNGNVSKITDHAIASETKTMYYDGMNRLTRVDGPWGQGLFEYDGLGNIKKKQLGSRQVNMHYNTSKNLLSHYVDNGVRKNFSYDSRGNVINNGRFSFVYDMANQPIRVQGSVSANFTYDGNKKRVKQTISGKTIYTVYSKTGAILYRDNVTDKQKTDYISLNGKNIAKKLNGTVTYTHHDHLGSAIASTSANGGLLWRESYTPFGEKRLNPSQNKDNQGFTGHIEDSTLNLTYMQARYYDPVIGRFYSNDPVGAGSYLRKGNAHGYNRYTYALNNPFMFIDPTGMFGCDPNSNCDSDPEWLEDAGDSEYTGRTEDGVPRFTVRTSFSALVNDMVGGVQMVAAVRDAQSDGMRYGSIAVAIPLAGKAGAIAIARVALLSALEKKALFFATELSISTFNASFTPYKLAPPMKNPLGDLAGYITQHARSQKTLVKNVKNDTVFIE